VGIENSGVISGGSSSTVSEIELEGDLEVLSNQRMFEPGEAIDIPHHASRPMEDVEKVAEKLLSPTTDLMDWPIVFQNFFDGAAVAEPKEF
jgi:hypothetical protein